jgi:hypothetical protein
MKLYHFTQHWNVTSIAEQGLRANLSDPEFMTAGERVVWLTARPSMALSPVA